MKAHKISTQLDDGLKKMEIKNCLNELNELKFCEVTRKQMLKVSTFYLEKQKSFIPKKIQAVVSK